MSATVELELINSAFVACPEALLLRGGRWRPIPIPVRYGLLRHPEKGPVLIDAGYSAGLYRVANASLPLRAYRRILRPRILPEGHPAAALPRRGIDPGEVRHVILTHLHLDHVGHLDAVPGATLHAAGAALDPLEGLPARGQARRLAAGGVFAECLPLPRLRGAARLEDRRARLVAPGVRGFDLFGDGSVLALPLPGHAQGHVGLLLRTSEGPVLYAADAAWTRAGLEQGRERPAAQRLVATSLPDLRDSAEVVRLVVAMYGAEVLLCHDPARTRWDREPLE